MKVASLVLSLLVAAPHGAAIAAPDAPASAAAPAAPPGAAPPGPAAGSPEAAPPALPALPALPVLPAPPPAPVEPAAAAAAGPAPVGLSIGPPSEATPAATAAPAGAEAKPGPAGGQSRLVAFSLSFLMPIVVVAGSALSLDSGEGLAGPMLVLGAVAGPSTGWLYVGRPGMAAVTAGMRLGGGLLAVRALDDRPGSGGGSPVLGVIIFATATLIDWIGPGASLPGPSQTTVVPAVQGGGAGLSFVGVF